MNNSFDPKNPRVKRAYQKKIFYTPPVLALCVVISSILIIGGGILLYFKNSFGWTLLGFSALPLMLFFWIQNHLNEIPIKKSKAFTDLVSEDLLTLLNKNLIPSDLIRIIPRTQSGTFLMVRFGLPIPFFENIKDFLPKSVEPIYDTAKTIREKTNSEEITGAILATAIIENLPNYEQLLNQLKLTISDLYQGIIWFNYLHGLVKNNNRPIHSSLEFSMAPMFEVS